MAKKQLTEEFRIKVVKEALETGEQGLVARRHDIHPVTLSRWVNNYKKYGKTTVYYRLSYWFKLHGKRCKRNFKKRFT